MHTRDAFHIKQDHFLKIFQVIERNFWKHHLQKFDFKIRRDDRKNRRVYELVDDKRLYEG